MTEFHFLPFQKWSKILFLKLIYLISRVFWPGIFKTFFFENSFFPFQIKLALLKKVQVRKSEEVQKTTKRVIDTVIITIDIIMVMDTITRRVTRKIVNGIAMVTVNEIAKGVKAKVTRLIRKDQVMFFTYSIGLTLY